MTKTRPKQDRRTVVLHVMLTQLESDRLASEARRQGMTVSSFVRFRLAGTIAPGAQR